MELRELKLWAQASVIGVVILCGIIGFIAICWKTYEWVSLGMPL